MGQKLTTVLGARLAVSDVSREATPHEDPDNAIKDEAENAERYDADENPFGAAVIARFPDQRKGTSPASN
jgi:hypothetical protein